MRMYRPVSLKPDRLRETARPKARLAAAALLAACSNFSAVSGDGTAPPSSPQGIYFIASNLRHGGQGVLTLDTCRLRRGADGKLERVRLTGNANVGNNPLVEAQTSQGTHWLDAAKLSQQVSAVSRVRAGAEKLSPERTVVQA